MSLHKIGDGIATGGICDQEGLIKLKEDGFQSIIDLCTVEEGKKMDENQISGLGFTYVHCPVNVQNLTNDILQNYDMAYTASPQPIYVRCATGRRANLLVYLNMARTMGWSKDEFNEALAKDNVSFAGAPKILEFIDQFFQTQSRNHNNFNGPQN